MGVAMACMMCTQSCLKLNKEVFAGSDYWTASAYRRYFTNQTNLKHVCLNVTLINAFTLYVLLSSNMSSFLHFRSPLPCPATMTPVS